MNRFRTGIVLLALVAMAGTVAIAADDAVEREQQAASQEKSRGESASHSSDVTPTQLPDDLEPAVGEDKVEVGVFDDCHCGPLQDTPRKKVDSPTSCSAATSLLRNTLRAMTFCTDGTCHENLVITKPCTTNGTRYWIEGFLEYRCNICFF